VKEERVTVILTDLHARPEHHIEALDITAADAVSNLVGRVKPDVILHCAAWTNVDGAEESPDLVAKVNVDGTANVAKAAEAIGAKLVAISTDYVFDGSKADGYREDDPTGPLGVYGSTKRDGELTALEHCSRTFVVRSAWLYGPKHERIEAKNFPKTMRRLASERPELSVVNDQIGSPTFTYDLAQAVLKLAATDDYGTWHIVNSGTASWHDFACAILADPIEEGLVVKPIPSSDYPTKATRPQFSVLKTGKFTNRFGPLRSWQAALADYLSSRASS
jgi:dTDP-4-dehydrorhamnose reductase